MWDCSRLDSRRLRKKIVLPSDVMEKGFRSLTAEREWDGKAGSPLVDRTGRECTIFWRDGIMEQFGHRLGIHSGV